MVIEFEVPGQPVPKPRMTRQDKWLRRTCVVAYRNYADLIRLALHQAGHRGELHCERLIVTFHLAIPKTSKAKPNTPHRLKPDLDNLIKGIFDSLPMKSDEAINMIIADKRWADERGPRTSIMICQD